MTTKRLETHTGVFLTVKRAQIVKASRAWLQDYLEARGFAVYPEEGKALLRETALEDFDGEKAAEPKEWAVIEGVKHPLDTAAQVKKACAALSAAGINSVETSTGHVLLADSDVDPVANGTRGGVS